MADEPTKVNFFRISEEGKRVVESGDMDFLHPLQQLFLEISYRLDRAISKENMQDLAKAMSEEFGSVEDALDALRDGRVSFKPIKLH